MPCVSARLLLGLLALIGSAHVSRGQPDDAAIRARLRGGVLRWGGDAEGGAPYQLCDPQDPERIIGFEVELAAALAETIARQTGVTLTPEFVPYDWVSLSLGLEKQDFDVAISGMEVTPENQLTMLFSRPYYVYGQQLVVRADETRIQSLADCGDKSVGTLSGSAADKILQRRNVGDAVGYDGQVEPYLDLETGRLDAVLLDWPIALFYASGSKGLKFVGEPIEKSYYAIALRHDDALLKSVIDDALGELMRNGRLRAILARWRIWNPDQARLARGDERARELAGLGFDPQGQPLPLAEQADDAVATDIVQQSAEHWTVWTYGPLLLAAAWMTVKLSIMSMAVAMALGLVVCVARLYGPAPVRALALSYVEFFRGIPLLLLLFFLYFGLPHFGLGMSAFPTAIIAFGLTYAAYEAEIYRSSIEAVPVGQWDAAYALGMPATLAFRRVILPQAWRTALGPMTNDFVALFKDTSLVSVISIHELTKEYLVLSRSSHKFVEMGLLTAALYLLMSVPCGHLSRWLEDRFDEPQT